MNTILEELDLNYNAIIWLITKFGDIGTYLSYDIMVLLCFGLLANHHPVLLS